MERQRKYKIFSIVALVVAICGMTLGFAAFSKVLTINANATVIPNSEDFNVIAYADEYDESDMTIIPVVNGATAENALISNGSTISLSNMKVNFSKPGQSVSYMFFVKNTGKYNAYVKKIEFTKVNDGVVNYSCVGADNVSSSLVSAACNDMEISLDIMGGEGLVSFNETTNISGSFMEPNYGTYAVVNIKYKEDGTYVDGDFSVDFGQINVYFSSAE